MNGVFIVPTGVGAEIGGHSGDATPAARLIASVCDKLIVHPNVVNASDINEMTNNMLYVEGSMLDRFLEGEIGLGEVYGNTVLVVVNGDPLPETINAINAARSTLGMTIFLKQLHKPLKMTGTVIDGRARGTIEGINDLIADVEEMDFDVLIVNTPIDTNEAEIKNYLTIQGGVNPWGGVEAELSKALSSRLGKPVIHAPIESSEIMAAWSEVVDPRKSAEMVSKCYIHCCFKGANKAPQLSMSRDDFWHSDIDFLITPTGLFGRPHAACIKNNIPVIDVRGNKPFITTQHRDMDQFIPVENYLEAVGVLCAMKQGISINSVTNNLSALEIMVESC